ncbi:YitT family protein, partial [Bacillus pumilus]|uniref:YitT family protein n=1 Tax=Bacillus pumilus TaxID=1408 RepID=UPI0021B4585B
MILIRSFLFAPALNIFLIPLQFPQPPVTALSIIFYYFFQLPPSLTNLLFNPILLLLPYKYFHKKTTIYTLLPLPTNSL